jgi:hypothetical protein
MKRLAATALVVTCAIFASAMTLGGCEDSCIDTGCVEDTGPDVKEAGKKDAAKEAASDAGSDVTVDAPSDASDAETDADAATD